MASGIVNTGAYSSSVGNAYLEYSWNATPNNGKYLINWNITAKGINAYYWLALHYLKLVVGGIVRYENQDVGINAYNDTVVASGNFESEFGSFSIELYGGYYSYGATNVSGSGVMNLPALAPIVSINEVSHTATTITIRCIDTNGINSSKYHVYNGSAFLKETTSKEIILENLTPNTNYKIKVYGYGNGGFGPESNTLSITTSKQSTITSVGDFTINGVKLTLSGDGNVVVIIDGKEIVRRDNIPAGEYELVLTEDEKQKIYELMGNNNSIKAIIRVETGNSYVDKEVNITLTGDVFSCKINVNSVNKRCKVWVGTSKGNKQGIFTIGTSKGNRRGR